ncbi:MAG: YggS family pyridoxal phosphate-dependent enzyme [Terriglobales bacterium]
MKLSSVSIAANLALVRERIAAAARCAGRNSDSVALMAVTKTFGVESIREAHAAGLRLFGENRVQEFAAKADAARALDGAHWHLIGHLQSNKAARAAELFDAVDTVDSLRIARKLNAAADARGTPMPVLIEINLAGEAAKSGVGPDSKELEDILYAAPQLEALKITGLMAIPPFTANPEDSRPHFRRLRKLRDQLAARKLPGITTDILSMGMSHDFEIAIEEGSTCVRLGAAIFGERPKE